jgi:hypothetical protein
MITAARIATGSRKRVLEDGPDVMNSDDEDSKKEEHGDKLTNMYANGCPSLDQARMTEQQAQALRAQAQGFSQSAPMSPSSSFSSQLAIEADTGVEHQKQSQIPPRPVARCEEVPFDEVPPKASSKEMKAITYAPSRFEETKVSEPMTQPQAKGAQTAGAKPPYATRLPEEPAQRPAQKKSPKAAAPPKAPPDQPKEAKASTPTKGQGARQQSAKGQESPGTKVPSPMVDHHPMATRAKTRTGSGAGDFRGVDGSGSIGAVCGSSSPARKPGS